MIKSSDTQRQLFSGSLSEAIAKDRAREELEKIPQDEDSTLPWQLWAALGAGSALIVIMAVL